MKVLVTGGAGFLGRGILRQVERGKLDWEVTVYSRDETKQDECRRRYPFANYILGDVKDVERLTNAMVGQRYVVHAAAMKYIPEAELNAAECVSVNVDGARNVIRAAKVAGVERVVGISTDKAVQPVNVYGASKMAMERLFADEARYSSNPSFICVRYGNVIGSTGSVIPLFQRQLAEHGEVSLTNPHMTRFWMSVDEAITLILIAFRHANPGSIIVPMARAMTLQEVAMAATHNDVSIKYVGERPGEKVHEALIHYEESVRVQINTRIVDQEEYSYFELRRPGMHIGERPFTLASHTPNRLMCVQEMRELIADAATI